jgi:hypothetical protein
MFKRAVRDAMAGGHVEAATVAELTDDALMELLVTRAHSDLALGLRTRRLYKRALDLPASDVPADAQPWLTDDPELTARVEDALAVAGGLAPGELLLDFPSRSSMLGVDLPLRLRGGGVDRLTDEGRAGQLGLPRVADELYRSARRLRLFVARPLVCSLEGLLGLLTLPAEELSRRLQEGQPLL